MARLVFGMNQSLDGYVDHMAFAPSPALFRHFIEEAQGQAGSVYGRQMYEVMRYWDDDRSEEHTSELQSRQYLVCRLLLENNDHASAEKPLSLRQHTNSRQNTLEGQVQTVSALVRYLATLLVRLFIFFKFRGPPQSLPPFPPKPPWE